MNTAGWRSQRLEIKHLHILNFWSTLDRGTFRLIFFVRTRTFHYAKIFVNTINTMIFWVSDFIYNFKNLTFNLLGWLLLLTVQCCYWYFSNLVQEPFPFRRYLFLQILRSLKRLEFVYNFNNSTKQLLLSFFNLAKEPIPSIALCTCFKLTHTNRSWTEKKTCYENIHNY